MSFSQLVISNPQVNIENASLNVKPSRYRVNWKQLEVLAEISIEGGLEKGLESYLREGDKITFSFSVGNLTTPREYSLEMNIDEKRVDTNGELTIFARDVLSYELINTFLDITDTQKNKVNMTTVINLLFKETSFSVRSVDNFKGYQFNTSKFDVTKSKLDNLRNIQSDVQFQQMLEVGSVAVKEGGGLYGLITNFFGLSLWHTDKGVMVLNNNRSVRDYLSIKASDLQDQSVEYTKPLGYTRQRVYYGEDGNSVLYVDKAREKALGRKIESKPIKSKNNDPGSAYAQAVINVISSQTSRQQVELMSPSFLCMVPGITEVYIETTEETFQVREVELQNSATLTVKGKMSIGNDNLADVLKVLFSLTGDTADKK